jgi:DNA uptake protein ComE-like DNA-binding protein
MTPRLHLPEPWTPPQRRVVIGIVAALVVYGSIRLFLNRAYISDPQPATPARANDLADKIDPNSADAATLSVLPLIGDKRAADIVAFRERYVRDHPDEVAFKSLQDLLKIRGIGASTIEQIRPYLMFPSDRPTTLP